MSKSSQTITVQLVPAEQLSERIHFALDNDLPIVYLPDSSKVKPGARTVEQALHERLPKTVGMDMQAPYGVYVDGVKVAEYADVAGANSHYESLARRGN